MFASGSSPGGLNSTNWHVPCVEQSRRLPGVFLKKNRNFPILELWLIPRGLCYIVETIEPGQAALRTIFISILALTPVVFGGSACLRADCSITDINCNPTVLLYAFLTQTPPSLQVPDFEVLLGRRLQLEVTDGTGPYTYEITSGSGSISSSNIFTPGKFIETVSLQVTDSTGLSGTGSIEVFGGRGVVILRAL